jgi:hypothetical protein
MKNITKIFIDTAPIDKRLSFGVNENVFLKSIDNIERRNKDGIILDTIVNMVFSKIDPETDKIVAESSISFFSPAGREYASKSFIHSVLQMMSIARAIVPEEDVKEVLTAMNAAMNTKEYKEVIGIAGALNAAGKKATETEFKRIVAAQKNIFKSFIEILEKYTGPDSSKVGLLMVTNYKGEFLGLPKEDRGFINKDASKIEVNDKYIRWKNKRNVKETAKADNTGNSDVVDISKMQVSSSGDLSDI